jgi:Ala-tRNA(Pro) deacylase
MNISATIRHYLDHSGTSYELVPHSRTFTSMESAQAAHVAGERLIKSVVVKEGDGGHHYAIVALPSTHRVQRLVELGLTEADEYRAYLESHPE